MTIIVCEHTSKINNNDKLQVILSQLLNLVTRLLWRQLLFLLNKNASSVFRDGIHALIQDTSHFRTCYDLVGHG